MLVPEIEPMAAWVVPAVPSVATLPHTTTKCDVSRKAPFMTLPVATFDPVIVAGVPGVMTPAEILPTVAFTCWLLST